MNRLQTFQQFLTNQNAPISVWGFVLHMFLAALLSFILSRLYIKYGNSRSNRRLFARNFILITTTTTLIITLIKASLALSLGLVGALSIVRFRAAIKEPEELAYLFLTIGVGLGLGADQILITIVAFVIITAIIWLRHFSYKSEENQNLYLTVSSHNPEKAELKTVVEILKKHCPQVNLKRFDETKEMLEASFLAEFDSISQLEATKLDLQELNDSIKISFLDNKGIG